MNYDIYHSTLGAAIQEIMRVIEKNGIILADSLDYMIWGCIGYDETSRYSFPIEGKREALQIQISRLSTGKYELNMYVL